MRMRHETIGTEMAPTRKKLTPWNGWKRSTRKGLLLWSQPFIIGLDLLGVFQGLCYRSITERPGFFSKDGRSLFRALVVSSVVAARQLFQGLYLKKNPRDLQLCCLKKMKHEHSCWSLKFEKNPPEVFRERIVCLSNLRRSASCRFVCPIVCDGSVSGRELLSGIGWARTKKNQREAS